MRDRPSSYSAGMLRHELSLRAQELAKAEHLLHDLSQGSYPAVLFGRDEEGRHGNFHPDSYTGICADPAWANRLTKIHTSWRKARARANWQWMELDSVNSSDALLMNIFCHPAVFASGKLSPAVATLLGVEGSSAPCFGIHPRVPLANGRTDQTEIDLQLGNLFVEAKLTESNFQQARPALIHQYRDLEAVFDVERLPRTPLGIVQGYQLIRNVLAAFASNASFCVLCDARRQDLIAIWWSVLSAVHAFSFTWRLKLLTWQELTSALTPDLQQFISAKYGIQPD